MAMAHGNYLNVSIDCQSVAASKKRIVGPPKSNNTAGPLPGNQDMNLANLLRLLALAAIWGASFLFMRIGAPVLGPVLMISCRVGFATLFLFLASTTLGKPLNVREHWRHYLIIGFFNCALPFLFFGIAAQTLSVSQLSVLNATAPIWGALIGAVLARQGLSAKTTLGLLLGLAGVAVLVGLDFSSPQADVGLAMLCALAAPFCYGIATNYAKNAKKVEPFANAHGSLWAASLCVLPAAPFFPAHSTPGLEVILAMVALGVVCSGVANLIYFRLVAEVGAASALTVTFLIPVFGILWGHLFLDEPLVWQTGVGALIVVVGTALVTGFSPASLLARKPVQG
jgi:drug/metabolite transporter (DMT)-like permease